MSSSDTPASLTEDAIASIRDNLDEVAERTATAAEASGRARDDVRVLLATKTQPAERIRVAIEHGFTLIRGEQGAGAGEQGR